MTIEDTRRELCETQQARAELRKIQDGFASGRYGVPDDKDAEAALYDAQSRVEDVLRQFDQLVLDGVQALRTARRAAGRK